MAHQSHIKSEKYRQWVKAGLGLGYLKEGLAPFCDDVAKQQHRDILDNIKRTKNIPTVLCGTCTLKTLRPDHVKNGKKQCPLSQTNCNCCYTAGKTSCPNKVCGAIYDSIITYHASISLAPCWKNTQTQQWIADPWSIAKCFINAPGYEQKTSAADTDCTGLLHVIINNKYFHNHISCNMTGHNIFSKVRQYRNAIFHSNTMELGSTKTNSYIDDMIAVLQDGKELIHRHDAQEPVKKLQDLKKEAFIITTEDVEKVLGDIRDDLSLIKGTTEGLEKEHEDQKRKIANLELKTSELDERLEKDNEDQKRKIANLELKISGLEEQIKYLQDMDYDSSKADLQEKLIKEYKDYLLRMPAMPFQPDHECNFEDVYVTPTLTIKSKDKDGKSIETEVKTMSDIFIKDGKPLKSIYILGEAGSGKSSFCKSLIHNWCIAHSSSPDPGSQNVNRRTAGSGNSSFYENLFRCCCIRPTISDTQSIDVQNVEENTEDHIVSFKVMKNFNFLFFLPLRQFKDKVSINEMLEGEYKHSVLKYLIERESDTCLIVLDGLDEWTSTLKCPPERAKLSNYTVLTTSRPWKMGSLGITDNEKRQSIHINGFDDISKWSIITKTVNILNKTFNEGKDPSTCKKELENKSFDSLTHTAMMFQQLICLWFDNRLNETSKCNLYTSMIDLFFVWFKKKVPDAPLFNDMLNKSHDIELPECFNKTDECKLHSYIIRCASRLAYKTLIKNTKEISLTIDSSTFQQLNISNDIISCCLKLGILSEEKGQSFSASRSRKSHLSFIHKSIQEYLAAVYIVLNINTEQEASLDTESADLSDYLSNMLHVKNVDELLEQENVLVMLCGLETRLSISISKLIYDIVTRDERVVKYRKTIETEYRDDNLIEDIQNLVLDCIEETKSSSNELHKFSFDLGDLFTDTFSPNSIVRGVNEQNITLDRVISINAYTEMENGECDERILDCMTKCKNLELIDIRSSFNKKVDQRISDIIESNASTLKSLSLENTNFNFTEPVRRPPFRSIANMTHLVALKVERFHVTHDAFASLCAYISDTGHLQQISIDMYCECQCKHEVNLSKHKQLQYLTCNYSVSVTKFESTNLEFIECAIRDQINCKNVLECFNKSINLTKIHLIDCLQYTFASDIELSNYYVTVTNMVNTFLPTLQHLRELDLHHFTFTENIITCPSEMKRLESIDVSRGTMSLTTWQKFVDSVAELPHRV